MTRNIKKIIYPGKSPFFTNAICNQVDVIADTPLEFNSKIVDDIKKTAPILKSTGTTRQIILQTFQDSDLSSITFTITGYQNGVLLTETLSGAEKMFSNPVTSNEFYDEVVSIIPNASSSEKLDVALGNEVYIFVGVDVVSNNFSTYGLSLNTYSTYDSFNVEIFSTLDNIKSNNITFKDLTDPLNGYLKSLDKESSSVRSYLLPPEKINITQSLLVKCNIIGSHTQNTNIIFNFIRV